MLSATITTSYGVARTSVASTIAVGGSIRGLHFATPSYESLSQPIKPISRIEWYKLQAKIAVLKRRLGDKYAVIARDKRRSPPKLRTGPFDFSRAPLPPKLTPPIDLLLAKPGYTCPLPIIPGNIEETLRIVDLVKPYIAREKTKAEQIEKARLEMSTSQYDASGVERAEAPFKRFPLPLTSTIDTTEPLEADLTLAQTENFSANPTKRNLPAPYIQYALTVESGRSIEDRVARTVAQLHLEIFDHNDDSNKYLPRPIRDGVSAAPYFLDGIRPEDLQMLVNEIPTVEQSLGLHENVRDSERIRAAEISKRMFTLDNASQPALNAFNRQRMILLFAGDLQNCGDTATQAAIATLNILRLQDSIEKRRTSPEVHALDKFKGKRDRLLKYLRKTDLKRYVMTCKALGVTPSEGIL